MRKLLYTIILCYSALSVGAQEYTNGVFILNEDWFGHNNSTINFLNTETEEFDYLIIQEANMNDGLSLGCTAQFGAIYGENIYIMSKQDQDPGENNFTGGRVVVADAKTMKIKRTIPYIAMSDFGKSIADGRGFVGVNESKGYVGTTNGIYIMDLNSFDITDRIEGSENPLITGEESNEDGMGPLYNNQIGMMIRTHDYVFAIQQDKGILVIDAKTDKIVKVINGCFSTMTQSKDGNIWAGRNTNQSYQKYPYGDFGLGESWEGNGLLKIDPITLETAEVEITNDGGINQTWYAWTAGSLCASTHENALYFIYNPDKWNWFITSKMYKYDIDNDQFSQIYDSTNDDRFFYGGGMRINPLDDKIYATLYRDNVDQSYWVYQLDNEGNLLNSYEPIERYWFPALVIFPDNHAPIVSDFAPIYLNDTNPIVVDLSTMASDLDNLDAAITKRIVDIDNEDALTAEIKNNKLTLTANENEKGTANITVQFNSNGKIVEKQLVVNVSSTSTTIESEVDYAPSVYVRNKTIYIENLQSASTIEVYNLHGQLITSQFATGNTTISDVTNSGVYIVKIENRTFKISI